MMVGRIATVTATALCMLGLGCASGRGGSSPATAVATDSDAVLRAARQAFSRDNIPFEPETDRETGRRLRSLIFRPFDIWESQVGQRVVCTDADGERLQPGPDVWLRVEVTTERGGSVNPRGALAGATGTPRIPVTIVRLSYTGGTRDGDRRGRCALTEGYAHTLLLNVVGRFPAARYDVGPE